MQALEQLLREVQEAELRLDPVRVGGTITEVGPSAYRVAGLSRLLKLGDVVCIDGDARGAPGEVVRIDAQAVTVKSFDSRVQAGVGHLAFRSRPMRLKPHRSWKGRVLNALGRPVDGLGPLLEGPRSVPIDAEPPAAMRRERVRRPVKSGIRVVDFFTPICAGQRIGIFAGSGVGKSTVLAMLAGSPGFDSVVIALVGERGREVREFLDDALGENRKLAITVVATGDESAMMRRLAPKTAMSIAEYLRDQGESVLLIVDSITRFAHAARDVALAAGEPAVARGYAPSVFSELPKLLERAGPGEAGGGSITGVFSVLVDGDDHNDPVADNIRGALDGHIVLDRAIADQGRYPAVNVLSSVSRLAHHVWTKEQRTLVMKLRAMIARYESSRDLRLMGGYHAGADPLMDQAVIFVPKIYEAMGQSLDDQPSADAFRELADTLQGDKGAEPGRKE
ncbi:flagellar protein export ATPase FliI [Rhodoblastus acidophilus]|uniref:Flagellum-specific ATP synthase n=1 Tax=Candidatus Rhodoblastus alkanivorans TaxID=2954117 RepID=A0ABS9Z551_9HYPH|nr:flagellar protein export ATPase FliI [Candidatus Rhodoblastus alkanivorans]MCI4678812.1 flagellar protein export ATPase FliI [Candidatus Rhodoblastus alkanivorans]MCI4682201.1 flagellar protein export ATPase FliI [Candidatus Rhodoblastus alkanivorans]MDI4639503.1 flagellar protein export ATPase FliI [Rhodoblastus acidophilus]